MPEPDDADGIQAEAEGTHPSPEQPGTTAGTIDLDRPCLACGYNLRGLSRSGVCPECGAPVARSLQGNLLLFSAPDFTAKLHSGVFLIQAGIIAQFVALFASITGVVILGAPALAGGPGAVAVSLIGLAASIASLGGWWLLSAPDPAFVGAENGANARKVVRATVVISAAATIVSSVSSLGAIPRPNYRNLTGNPLELLAIGLGLASMVAWVVWFFAAMRYLQWLAPRLPDERAFALARRMKWLGPLICVLGLPLCGLGPLIALILYYNLLEWVRKDLKRVRTVQAEDAAPA
jgi:hypothetical protein